MRSLLTLCLSILALTSCQDTPNREHRQQGREKPRSEWHKDKYLTKHVNDLGWEDKSADGDEYYANEEVDTDGSYEVWVNPRSRVYHCPDSQWYGKTKEGEYMTEAEAIDEGYRPAYHERCAER